MIDAFTTALGGINVVALVTNIPGPIAAARLRALGATVTKIEPPSGDPLEHASHAWYEELTDGLALRRLDLRDDAALATLESLLHGADVLLTATRSSVLERLNLRWTALHERHPKIVHVALCGEAPPHDDRAGHDLTYQAHAGTIAPPAMPRALIGDMAAAERAVTATLAALVLRERTGRVERIDVSIVECARDFAEPYRRGLTASTGPLGGALPTYAVYPAQIGYVAVAALEPHFIERLKQLLGTQTLTRESIGAVLIERDAASWEHDAQRLDVPLAAVR